MRLRDYILLAYKNISTYKKNTALIVLSFTLVISLLVVFVSYIVFGNTELNQILYSNASECRFSTSSAIDAAKYGYHPEVKQIERFYFDGFLNNYTLVVDNKDCVFEENSEPFMIDPNEKMRTDNYYAVQIDSLEKDSTLFTNMDKFECQARYDNSKMLLYGALPSNENELLISESLLKLYGIEESIDSVVGKKISFIRNHDSAVIFEDCVISGIISSEYFRMSGTYEDSHIIFMDDTCEFNASSSSERIYRYYANSYEEAKEMYDFAKSIGLQFNDNSSVKKYESMLVQKNVIWKIIAVALILMTIMILLFVLVTEYFAYTKKKMFVKTEIYLGMTQSNLLKLLYVENLMYILLSMIISIILSPYILYLVKMLVMELFRVDIGYNYLVTYLLLIGFVVFFSIFVFLISLFLVARTVNELFPAMKTSKKSY